MLYLLPNLLSDTTTDTGWLAKGCFDIVPHLDGLICESEKSARKYLKLFTFPEGKTFRDVPLLVLNEHTSEKELEGEILPRLLTGTWGLISDAGLPSLADPGSALVARARARGVRVTALPGPSSIVLSLMLSGLPSQAFAFHGYLPREHDQLTAQIRALEERSHKEKATQLFIEAPYRNLKTVEALCATLKPHTLLTVASDLTGPQETVLTRPVKEWRSASPPPIHKIPAIFLFFSVK